jgi:hypothetical protein
VSDGDRRSALVVVAVEAEAVVGEWRLRHQRESVERRIPPHLTVLFPFVPATAIEDDTLAELRRLYAPVRPFGYELASVESFPDAAWLAPAPVQPFHELVARARRASRAPPYGAGNGRPHTIGIDGGPDASGDGASCAIVGRPARSVAAPTRSFVGEQANDVGATEAFPFGGDA